ncbi:MAG: serine hydrolase domain-containing protein [Bacteroidota bacterium]
MRNYYLTILLLISFFSCSSTADETDANSSLTQKQLKLDSLFSSLHAAQQFNGTVLIAENGEPVYQKAFGVADLKSERKLNLMTTFELASVSKQFTAMSIVQLQKASRLAYDDELATHIPELNAYPGITIQHLLTHTSGLPDYMELAEAEWDHNKIATNEDIIALFSAKQPEVLFQPNEYHDYSNTGYLLLGTIIERVSGKSFEDYLQESIFQPVGMKRTFVYRRRYAPEAIKNYATGYVFSDSLNRFIVPDSLPEEHYTVYLDGIVGDGMVNSNLEDLLKWDRALYTNQLITPAERSIIFSSYYTEDNTPTDYGFGWSVDSLKAYGKIVEHSGGWAGYVTHIERHLDHDKTIIMLQNQLSDQTELPIKNARKILYEIPIEHPVTLDSLLLKQYAGSYLTASGEKKSIVYRNGKLFYPINEAVDLELVPVSSTKFILEGFSPEVSYTFSVTENNTVESCRVQQPEQDIDRTLVRTTELLE